MALHETQWLHLVRHMLEGECDDDDDDVVVVVVVVAVFVGVVFVVAVCFCFMRSFLLGLVLNHSKMESC